MNSSDICVFTMTSILVPTVTCLTVLAYDKHCKAAHSYTVMTLTISALLFFFCSDVAHKSRRTSLMDCSDILVSHIVHKLRTLHNLRVFVCPVSRTAHGVARCQIA